MNCSLFDPLRKANWRWMFVLPLLGGIATAEEPARKLTLDEAVDLALRQNTAVLGARTRQQGADASEKSVRGRLLLNLHASDEWQHYTNNFAIVFPGLGGFNLRQIVNNTFVVSADQPLLGLLKRSQDYMAAGDQTDAAEATVRAAEAGVREAVATRYLQYFEAHAAEDIARASQQELNEQVAVAKSKLTAGVLTTADVLRLQVAVANARQQEIQAQASELVSRAAILTTIGIEPTDDSVDFVEPTDLENRAPAAPAMTDAFQQAQHARPELAAAMFNQSAAAHQAKSRFAALLPDVDLEGAYLNINGQVFAQNNSGFVGLKAEWNFFDWGADWYAHEAADAQATGAEIMTEDTRRNIGADLSARLSQEKAAIAAMDVAQTTITSAEEAFRVTQALVKAGSATTTDLITSQSELTQARLNLVRAKYEQAIAHVAVQRGIGADPTK